MSAVGRVSAGLAAGVFAALFLLTAGAAPAHAAGYWTCKAGQWSAVGSPQHAKPTKPCAPKFTRPRTRTACLAAGGRWARAGLSPRPICTMPTRDGGRICADGGECDGACVATLTPEQRRLMSTRRVPALGRCTTHTPVFGCRAFVTAGYVTGILCVD